MTQYELAAILAIIIAFAWGISLLIGVVLTFEEPDEPPLDEWDEDDIRNYPEYWWLYHHLD